MADSTAWLKKFTPQIFETLSLSDKGSPPSFPLKEFSDTLRKSLGQNDLSIKIEKMEFIAADSFFEGLDQKTLSTPLTLSPLDGIFHLIMGIKDVQTLISCMEESPEEKSSTIPLENESIIKGIYTYFITEAIDTVMQLNIYKDLSLKMMEGTINELSAYCITFTLSIKGHHLLGKILIPDLFYKAFQTHFTFIPPTLENLENIPNINIPISIQTGSITLDQKEIKDIHEGDYLILKNSFYKPSLKKGSFQLLVGKSPLFQIKLAKDGIKILDYLYFYTEENMDDEEITSPLGENSDEDFKENNNHSDVLDTEKTEDNKDTFLTPEKTNLSNVPLTVQMEIARFSLSLAELKKMSPGSKLPININPSEVNLVISGKSIGTGEIIEIGDTIGVKVTKLYN